MILLKLFWEFFKTGLFAVGGGMATVPFLYDISDKTGWFTHAELANFMAVAESTPGPIGVNMATYVGFTTAGIPGAVVATLGLVAPSIIVIIIVAGILKAFKENKYVKSAFYALRPASSAMVASAGISVVEVALLRTDLFAQTGKLLDLFNFKALILAAVLLLATNVIPKVKDLHPIVYILGSAAVGVLFGFSAV
ncbi:MAG: chromate transporter [Oscillospiraceae bacterium]|nr:chromate transporter [Oscillospiraceae bacterium]